MTRSANVVAEAADAGVVVEEGQADRDRPQGAHHR
jgi:hypothetical protein